LGLLQTSKIYPNHPSGGDMSKIAVVTDSTAYIPSDLVQKHNLTVTPQVLIWGGETFQDGVDIQPDEFYARLKTAKVMPTTSQVSPAAMKSTFEGLIEKGYDVLGIFVSAFRHDPIRRPGHRYAGKRWQKSDHRRFQLNRHGNGLPGADRGARNRKGSQPG
jgi:hypothetical protein